MNQPILDFSSVIEQLSENFIGRTWVLDIIDHFTQSEDKRYLIFVGEPGIGKSAIAAHLVKMKKVHAHHFCIARQSETINPSVFINSISNQLSQTLSDFHIDFPQPIGIEINAYMKIEHVEKEGSAHNVHIDKLIIPPISLNDLFDEYVKQPLKKWAEVHSKTSIILLVDALDECERLNQHPNIIDLILNTQDMPKNVRWVLTSRPRINWGVSQEVKLVQIDQMKKNMEDIQLYVDFILKKICSSLDSLPSIQWLENVKSELIHRSEGNFLYLYYVLQSAKENFVAERPTISWENLPKGLSGMYNQFLDRIFDSQSRTDWRSIFQPVLGILTVVQEAIDFDHLVSLSQCSPQETNEALLLIAQFLEEIDLDKITYYRIYHLSFVDFLSNHKLNPKYWVDPIHYHRQIANIYLDLHQNDWSSCDNYGLNFLPFHLALSKQWDDLHNLIGLPKRVREDWMYTRLFQENSLKGYFSDIDLAKDIARLQGRKGILWQLRYAIIYSSLTTQSMRISPGLLAVALLDRLVDPTIGLDLANTSVSSWTPNWSQLAVAPYLDEIKCKQLLQQFGDSYYFRNYSNLGILQKIITHFLEHGWHEEILELIGKITSPLNWVLALRKVVKQIPEFLQDQISDRLLILNSVNTCEADNILPHHKPLYAWTAGALALWATIMPEDKLTSYLEKARQQLVYETKKERTWIKSEPGPSLGDAVLWAMRENNSGDGDDYTSYLLPFLDHLSLDVCLRCVEIIPQTKYDINDSIRHMIQYSLILRYLQNDPIRKKLENKTLNYWCPIIREGRYPKLPWREYFRGLSPEGRIIFFQSLLEDLPHKKVEFFFQNPDVARVYLLGELASFLPEMQRSIAIDKALTIFSRSQNWIYDLEGFTAIDACIPHLNKDQIIQIWELSLMIRDIGEQRLMKETYSPSKTNQINQIIDYTITSSFRRLDDQINIWKTLCEFVCQNELNKHAYPDSWDFSNFLKNKGELLEEYLFRLQSSDFNKELEIVKKENMYWNGSGYPYLSAIFLLCLQAAKSHGNKKRALLEQAFRIARREGHPLVYGDFLREILPICDTKTQYQITEYAIPRVRKHHSTDAIAVTIAGLIPFSNPSTRSQVMISTLKEAIRAKSGKINEGDYSIDQVFLVYASLWQTVPVPDLEKLLNEIIDHMKYWRRQDFLRTLASLMPVINYLIDEGDRSQVPKAIEEILTIWP